MTCDIRKISYYGTDVEEVCARTNTWHSEDFTIYLYADGNWSDNPEQRDLIISKAKAFAEKWNFINEIREPYEDEFLIFDSQTLQSEQLPKFVQDVQEIIDCAWNMNASVDIKSHMIPEDGQKDTILKMVLDENHIIKLICEEKQ